MKKEDYPFTMTPFGHQLTHFNDNVEKYAWGLLWEQGTAKTAPVITTGCWLYEQGKIDAMIVVAPPGVERNWNSEELPKHTPKQFYEKMSIEVFLTSKKGSKKQKLAMEQLIKFNGFAVLLISYNAFMTLEGKLLIWKFLKARKVLYALDESHYVKTPNAKRTKSIIASGKYAIYKRILTGTPVAQGAFDIYSQIRFLDENFWKVRGISNFFAFKNYFGKWFTREDCKRIKGYDPKFDQLLGYKNLDTLFEWISEISDRVLKEDVLDLPPKLYSKRYMFMSREQEKIYNELKEEYIYEFENGDIIDGELAIVRLMRLQQVLCGYVPVHKEDEDETTMRLLEGKNPRITALEDILDETHRPGIIWARFIQDIDQIMELMEKKKLKAVRYDGSISGDQAEKNKLAFTSGEAQWFVGTAQKGGPGLTLHQAKTVVYYSNSFKLVDRLQSEDRAHRAGMDGQPVLYIDIICPGTVDERIVKTLRDKKDIANEILGDKPTDWL